MTLPAFIGSLTTEHRICDWIRISPDKRIVLHAGKVDLGQGVSAALVAIAAEELGVDPHLIDVAPPSTAGVDEGFTAGSMSMTYSGTAVRLAAQAMRVVMGTAPDRQVDIASAAACDLDRGVVDVLSAAGARAGRGSGGAAGARVDVQRRDLAAKVAGAPAFIHDLRLPGQLFARIVRRSGRRAVPDGQILEVVDRDEIVEVIIDGAFIAVVATSAFAAIRTANRMHDVMHWEARESARGDDRTTVIAQSEVSGGTRRFEVRVTRPNLAHASIGPACAIARWSESGDELEVWTHSQGVHPLRRELATALGLTVDAISVQHVEGAGCYGHNGADDVAYDAALVARRLPGVPVQVTWDRRQELTCGPMGPRMTVTVSAETDEAGRIVAWDWSGTGEGHVCRPGMVAPVSLLAHADVASGAALPPSADPPAAIGGGTERNGLPLYDVPVGLATSTVAASPLRTSAIRSLGAFMNVIATEAMMDEVAAALGEDPVALRLRHLSDERAAAVLLRAVEIAGECDARYARGVGVARYKGTGGWCAVVADVEAQTRVDVRSVTVVADVGRVASRDGVLNQLEGGAIQAMSWTVVERLPVQDGEVLAKTWGDYPILRFPDVPRVMADVIDRPDEPFLGAGEVAAGPTGAAICNALARALGIRVTQLPLTPESIMRAIG